MSVSEGASVREHDAAPPAILMEVGDRDLGIEPAQLLPLRPKLPRPGTAAGGWGGLSGGAR